MTEFSREAHQPKAFPEEGVSFHGLTDDAMIWATYRSGDPTKGEAGKVPVDAKTGRLAKSSDPSTWSSRITAVKRSKLLAETSLKTGIGLMLAGLDDYPGYCLCGIDIDGCRDPETGEVDPIVQTFLDKLDTYAEVSPSGSGLHVFVVAREVDREQLKAEGLIKPGSKWGRDFRVGKGREFAPRLGGGKFLTYTGKIEDEMYAVIGDMPVNFVDLETLRWMFEEYGPEFVEHYRQELQEDEDNGDAESDDRSGPLVGFYKKAIKNGLDKDQADELLISEDHIGWHHAQEQPNTERALKRAWEKAIFYLEQERAKKEAIALTMFEDLTQDERTSTDPIISRVNRDYAIVDIPNGVTIVRFRDDSIDFLTRSAFELKYANKTFQNNEDKKTKISTYWLHHPDRLEYDDLIFDPGRNPHPGALNLYRGLACDPVNDPDSCVVFIDLLKNVICDGNEELFDYLIRWMAHIVQFPHIKPGVALVFVGGRGVGKDSAISYLGKIFRPENYRNVSHPRHVVGNFNANQKQALLLHMQEGVFAGNKADNEVLKALITSERTLIEPKGMEPFEIESFLRLAITTNSLRAIPAAADERRFAVFKCGAKLLPEFYERLYAERENGGPAAVLGYLQDIDLTGFNIRKAPESAGLQQQKLANLEGVDAWWFEILVEGVLPISLDLGSENHPDWDEAPVIVSKSALRDSYIRWNNDRRFSGNPPNPELFTKLLKNICAGVKSVRPNRDGKRERCFELPSRPECIKLFEEHYGVTLDNV